MSSRAAQTARDLTQARRLHNQCLRNVTRLCEVLRFAQDDTANKFSVNDMATRVFLFVKWFCFD